MNNNTKLITFYSITDPYWYMEELQKKKKEHTKKRRNIGICHNPLGFPTWARRLHSIQLCGALGNISGNQELLKPSSSSSNFISSSKPFLLKKHNIKERPLFPSSRSNSFTGHPWEAVKERKPLRWFILSTATSISRCVEPEQLPQLAACWPDLP